MTLIATYSFRYGRQGPRDAGAPLVERGEEFDAQPTAQASAIEVERHLIAAGVAVTPEVWAKRRRAYLPSFGEGGRLDWFCERG
ncbi:MAG: hypothetical protein MUE98_00265 [Rhodobacteraceae bacterium]|jgi:hypothetical protein|nr:hypothetical protein [Paracoccaceae bacterium]